MLAGDPSTGSRQVRRSRREASWPTGQAAAVGSVEATRATSALRRGTGRPVRGTDRSSRGGDRPLADPLLPFGGQQSRHGPGGGAAESREDGPLADCRRPAPDPAETEACGCFAGRMTDLDDCRSRMRGTGRRRHTSASGCTLRSSSTRKRRHPTAPDSGFTSCRPARPTDRLAKSQARGLQEVGDVRRRVGKLAESRLVGTDTRDSSRSRPRPCLPSLGRFRHPAHLAWRREWARAGNVAGRCGRRAAAGEILVPDAARDLHPRHRGVPNWHQDRSFHPRRYVSP